MKPVLCFVLTLMFSFAAYAGGVFFNPIDSLIPFDKDVQHGVLANGFAYYLRPIHDSSSIKRIYIKLIVKAGTKNEGPGQMQASHVIEHIAASATKNFPDVRGYLTRAGIQMGKDAQAYTGSVSTRYELFVPPTQRAQLDEYIRLVYDEFANPIFDSTTIERERQTVLSEIGTGGNGRGFSFGDLLCAPEIEFDISAAVRHLKRMSQDSLIAFYKSFYVPDRAALVIVGDFDPEHVKKLVIDLFGQLAKSNVMIHDEDVLSVGCPGEKVFIDSVANQDFYSVERTWLIRAHPVVGKGWFYRKTNRDFFNAIIAERLRVGFNGVWPAGVYGSMKFVEGYPAPDLKLDGLVARLHLPKSLTRDEAMQITRHFFLLVEQVRKYGFTELEMRDVRNRLLKKIEISVEDPDRYYLNLLSNSFLNGEVTPAIAYRDSLCRTAIQETRSDDINREFLKNISSDLNYYSIRFPKYLSGKVPLGSDIHIMLSDIKRTEIPRYQTVASVEKQIMSEDEIMMIRKKNYLLEKVLLPEIRTTVVKLSNGVTLIVKNVEIKKNGQQKMVLNGVRRRVDGDLNSRDLDQGLASARMVTAGGVKGYSRLDMNALHKRSGTYVFPYVIPSRVGIHGESNLRDFEKMMQLVKRFIEDPRVGPANDELKSLRYSNEVKRNVYDSLNYVFVGDNDMELRLSDNAKIRQHRALRSYRKLFEQTVGFVFVLTGSFDTDSMIAVVAPYLGSISGDGSQPPRTSVTTFDSGYTDFKDRHDAFEVVDRCKQNDCALNFLLFNDSDGGPVSRAECLLLKELLTDRLYYLLRTQMGGVYRFSVSEVQIAQHQHRFTVFLQTNYENIEAVRTLVWNELSELSSKGIEQSWVAAAADRAIADLQKNDDEFWQQYFIDQVLSGRDCREISDWIKILRFLRTVPINDVAGRWLRFENVVPITKRQI